MKASKLQVGHVLLNERSPITSIHRDRGSLTIYVGIGKRKVVCFNAGDEVILTEEVE